MVSDRREAYLIDHRVDRLNVVSVCRAVFDVLDPVVAAARVDAYSDYAEQMPADIAAADAWLRDRGLQGGSPDPAAAIHVARTDEVGWSIVSAYTLWSTRVALYDKADTIVATIEDGGHAIAAELTEAEAATLGDRIGGTAVIIKWTETTSMGSQPTA